MKLDAQTVGNAGLYYACYRLSCFGWNVMPTSRNARGIDIVAYNSSGARYLGLQIKTLSRRSAVPLGGSLDKVRGDYWIIVNRVISSPTAFILKPTEIRRLAIRRSKEGRESFWLSAGAYDSDKFREAWDRIGSGGRQR